EGVGAKAVGGRGQRRGVEQRNRWDVALLGDGAPFEAQTGVGDSGDAGVTLKGIVGQAQLEILEQAELQEAVHILVAIGELEAVFDLENTALHGLSSGGDGRAVGNGGESLLIVGILSSRIARTCRRRRFLSIATRGCD